MQCVRRCGASPSGLEGCAGETEGEEVEHRFLHEQGRCVQCERRVFTCRQSAGKSERPRLGRVTRACLAWVWGLEWEGYRLDVWVVQAGV